MPQFLPRHEAALSGVQPHTPMVPLPPQVSGSLQVPQEIICPQLFTAGPQL